MALRKNWTSEDVAQFLDYCQNEMELVTGIDAMIRGVTPVPPKSLKFPDHFFELHKTHMQAALRAHPNKQFISFRLRETYDYHFTNNRVWYVTITTVETDKGIHIIPATLGDVKTAEQWLIRNAGVGEDEFIN